MKLIVFAPIAQRDVDYYLAVADQLKSFSDLKIAFFSFYQPGNSKIASHGFQVLDPYKATAHAIMDKSGVDIQNLLLHEKVTFNVNDDVRLTQKFNDYLDKAYSLLADFESENNFKEAYIFQELAGFIGPLSLYFAGMKRGWKNLFFEPSFFKGRIHLLENSLDLNIDQTSAPTANSNDFVGKYLKSAQENKVVVAAKKDLHHYMDMGFKKLVNATNSRKLFLKVYYKYLRGQKQEFEHIFNHVQRNIGMLVNRKRNQSNYSQTKDLNESKNYFFFPFHVQLDFSLTIRSPKYLDQLALIENILKHLPENTVLLTKEHPASIGCLDQSRLSRLVAKDNFKIMHPQINSYDIISKCKGIISINSKVAAETVSLGQPAISFGKAFYNSSSQIIQFLDWPQFKIFIKNCISGQQRPDSDKWKQFLAHVYEQSYASELYDLKPQNVTDLTEAIQTYLNSQQSHTTAESSPQKPQL